MKRKMTKPLALLLSAVMLVSCVGTTVYAVSAGKESKTKEEPAVVTSLIREEDADVVKDETVYVLAGADGSANRVIVSDWLKNTLGSASITEKSDLADVENVKGDETFTTDGSGNRVWDAQGNDIYYQGDSSKALPVNLKISYTLDGSPILPDALAGKSGKVTIRIDYENTQSETVTVDGKQEKLYVPFVALTGLLLDNDVFRNVEVTNGKLMNDGSRTAVVGIALPGMQENLGIDKETLEIPSYVEIKADVENFAMANTVTVVTNEVFNKLNTEGIGSVDELESALGSLTSAMTQLLDGSSQLYEGLETLLEKSGTLVDGIDALADGLGQLSAKNNELNGGAKKVFESLLSAADTQLAAAGLSVQKLTISNYAQVLNGVIASLDETSVYEQAVAAARQKVTQAVNAKRDEITAAVTQAVQEQVTEAVTEAVRAQVEEKVLASLGMTKESYDAGVAAGVISAEQQAQITAAINAQMESAEVQATISQTVAAKMASAEIQATITAKTDEQIAQLIEQNMNSPEVQAQITAALEQAKSGAAAISSLKGQLDQYNQFYVGLAQYTAGVGKAYSGAYTMQKQAPSLVEGITQLRDGAKQLADGLKEFNEKGIEKLVNAVDGDLSGIVERLTATVAVSRNYKSFSGLSDDMGGQVKFIYRTDAVEAE